MYLPGISASPRRGGNSETLLQSFLQGAADAGWKTELIRLNDLRFRPCQACDSCAPTGQCVLKDDMQDIYPKIISGSGLVLATPIYFGTLSAQLKMFIDRFQCWWHAKYNLKKPFILPEENRPAYFICVGALKKKEYCEHAATAVKILFHNMNLHSRGVLSFRGYDEKGSISQNPDNLEKAYQEGYQFAVQATAGSDSA